ncbi:MAG: hypothetical protein LQ351_001906 [Letrouitia transgressa]|nr:MAG: hypothetical protein LQ351_001906 [Letrouitia transgressa]
MPPNPPPTPHQERLARGHHPVESIPKGKAKADPSIHFAENRQIREWESRNQRDKMARMLGSWEILAWSGALRDESLPQTRLRLQKKMLGIEEDDRKDERWRQSDKRSKVTKRKAIVTESTSEEQE